MTTRLADPVGMKLLSALVRDPNLIHLVGERPVNQGPIVMTWLLETARQEGFVSSFRVRFVSEIRGGDTVTCTVATRVPTSDGLDLTLEAYVVDTLVAAATASVRTP